jgi:hypothetical protein
MTGDVHQCFRGEIGNSLVLAKAWSLIAALAVCFAMYLETASKLRAAPQQNISGSNTARVSHAPLITAKPKRVTVSDGNGSTEIEWDTENGSMGFVFVTEDGGKPRLFADGSRGKQVAPWIKKHGYVFELYADDQRQMLLATATISGFAESVSPQRRVSWQAVGRGALVIGLAAVMYFAVYLSSTGPVRTTFPTEPRTSSRQLHVGRNLLLGIAAFRDHRQRRGLAASTLNTDMTVLSAAFNAARRQGHIRVNPCEAIESLKERTAHKSTFTPEQVTALIKAADGEWPGLILMAFYTGARLGDCANLQ